MPHPLGPVLSRIGDSEPALGQLSGLFIHNHPFKCDAQRRPIWGALSLVVRARPHRASSRHSLINSTLIHPTRSMVYRVRLGMGARLHTQVSPLNRECPAGCMLPHACSCWSRWFPNLCLTESGGSTPQRPRRLPRRGAKPAANQGLQRPVGRPQCQAKMGKGLVRACSVGLPLAPAHTRRLCAHCGHITL